MGDRSVFSDPRQARYAGWLIVGLLTWVAVVLRMALDIDGVLDTDVMNFGLAAFEFDVLAHQPHPPGYPGYVLFLKILHAAAPGLDPIEVAKWGARLSGAAVVPAVYWAGRQALGGGREAPVGRPLIAAVFAVFHPILWFYGGDGQSHSAEALLTVLLFGAAIAARRRDSDWGRLLLVAAFGLSGAVRPTIPLLASPLLVWVFWRKPLSDWALAAVVGAVSVVAWYVPLIAAVGGLDLYGRATKALVSEIFVSSYSVFGDRATLKTIGFNVLATAYSAALAIIPLLALRWRPEPWLRALLVVAVTNAVFYALVFTSEPGYLSQVAALACLAPATWQPRPTGLTRVRGAAVVALSFGIVWFGPAGLPLPAPAGFVPSYARVVSIESRQQFHRELVCGAAAGEPTLVITDNPVTTHNRWLAMVCPNVTVALHLHKTPGSPFRDDMDSWLILKARTMDAVPGPVPLEPGPPASYVLPPVAKVLLTPGTSDAWRAEIAAAATCEPARLEAPGLSADQPLLAWPARCFTAIRSGAHTLWLSHAAP